MKKFKKSIEISTENISDVLQVPIVSSLRMELVIALMRLGLLLRRIHLAQISSIRK